MNRANGIRKMTALCLLAGLIFFSAKKSCAQISFSADDFVERAANEIERMNESRAMDLLERALHLDSNHKGALWRLSLLHSKDGYRQEEEERKQKHYEQAVELAERCIENHASESNCHYVYAVALGRQTENAGPRTRVHASGEIRDHIDKALELDPENRGAWHILGVWHSSAANLSGAERFAANLLFGGAPKGASNEEAEKALLKAIELDPENILFRLDLARFYRDRGRQEEAVSVLEEILEMEIRDQDDPRNLERAEEMLERLQ